MLGRGVEGFFNRLSSLDIYFTSDTDHLDGYRVAARAELDEAAWERVWGEGQAMTLEEAVSYALEEEDTDLSKSPALEESSVGRPPVALTHREEEVATLVARGLTNRQVASELSISTHTAATHVKRILKKLGFHSRSKLSSWVTERGRLS